MRSISISTSSMVVLAILVMPTLLVSASGGAFTIPVNLGAGFNPNVQSAGSNVYVAWTDKSAGIMFRSSSNGGQSWNTIVKVGSGGQFPIISATGGHIYIVWSSGGINFVSSANGGVNWSKPMKISPAGGIPPYVASDGAFVSVVFNQGSSSTSYVTSSSD